MNIIKLSKYIGYLESWNLAKNKTLHHKKKQKQGYVKFWQYNVYQSNFISYQAFTLYWSEKTTVLHYASLAPVWSFL